MKHIIQPWLSFQYHEVWEIIEKKEGCIYKTRNTNKVVRAPATVDPQRFILVTISCKNKLLKVDLVEDTEFHL